MTRQQAHVYLGALAVVVLFGLYAFGTSATEATTSEPPRTVRWLLAHEPADVYTGAIDVFAEALARESNGRLKLETMTPSEAGIDGQASHEEISKLLAEGSIELSSTFGVANGTNDVRFWAWQLPFLFENYRDVENAFKSATGEELLTGLSDNAPYHALAYTLSGGLRIIASSHALASVSDLRGLRIATAGGPVAEATLEAVGAIPIKMSEGAISPADIDAVETTYARLTSVAGRGENTKHILETNHSLFLTTLVASDEFYDSLSPEDQQALTRAARAAAEVERADAIALNETTKAALQKNGSVVTTLTAEERDVFRQAAQSVRDTFGLVFGSLIPGSN